MAWRVLFGTTNSMNAIGGRLEQGIKRIRLYRIRLNGLNGGERIIAAETIAHGIIIWRIEDFSSNLANPMGNMMSLLRGPMITQNTIIHR